MAQYYISDTALTGSELQANAQYILNDFVNAGWSKEAVCAMLGNMQYESTINPGVWQNHDPNHAEPWGYGLVQWTPSTKYTDWASGKGFADDMIGEIARIKYEVANGIQWISTSGYPMTFKAFTTSTLSPSTLTSYWMHDYERPASYSSESTRQSYAANWFNTLTVGDSSGGGGGNTGGGGGHGTLPPPKGGQGQALMNLYLSHALKGWTQK